VDAAGSGMFDLDIHMAGLDLWMLVDLVER
jgi:hypothetical protein